jgi:hypothetical protein
MVDTVLALESGKWAGRLYYSILMLRLKARIISTITFALGVTIRDIFLETERSRKDVPVFLPNDFVSEINNKNNDQFSLLNW